MWQLPVRQAVALLLLLACLLPVPTDGTHRPLRRKQAAHAPLTIHEVETGWRGGFVPKRPGPRADRQMLDISAPRRPFKIHFDYRLGPDTSKAKKAYLKERLMPTMAAVLERYLEVKWPVGERLRLTPFCTGYTPDGRCLKVDYSCADHIQLPQEYLAPEDPYKDYWNPVKGARVTGGEGVDADFIMFVTTPSRKACKDLFATASVCTQDWDQLYTGRPTSGVISMCEYGEEYFLNDVQTVVHEAIHTLVFSAGLLGNVFGFIDATNTQWVQPVQVFHENGEDIAKIVTPRVVEAARAQFGCDLINGANLENQNPFGVVGSIGVHWEETLYLGEIMSTYSGKAITNLTLALLEDSGWYLVNYDKASYNNWGSGGGCLFATSSAQTLLTSPDSTVTRHFCNIAGPSDRCSYDLGGRGLCGWMTLNVLEGLSIVEEFDRCQREQLDPRYGDGGPNSRCIGQTKPGTGRKVKGIASVTVMCRKMFCIGNDLYVELSDRNMLCPSGTYVDAGPDFEAGTKVGPCPDNWVLCGTEAPNLGWLECPNNCNGHGTCLRGKCYCDVAFTGPTCARMLCTPTTGCPRPRVCHDGSCWLPSELDRLKDPLAGLFDGVDLGLKPMLKPKLANLVQQTTYHEVCSAKYGQCGGLGWAGSRCCNPDSTCTAQIVHGTPNIWYKQCL